MEITTYNFPITELTPVIYTAHITKHKLFHLYTYIHIRVCNSLEISSPSASAPDLVCIIKKVIRGFYNPEQKLHQCGFIVGAMTRPKKGKK